MTWRVFVPLVGANGQGAQLFEAIADGSAPEPHPAKLAPQISELFDFGLYGVGQTVREAVVRFVGARRSGLWLNRYNGSTAPWHLRISDLQIGRLSEENARSAGLGLAIAAIGEAFGRPPKIVFATGEIQLGAATGSFEIGVGAVDGVRGKLGLIGDYLVQHRAILNGEHIFVALPATAPDGRPTLEAEARLLERLRAAADDAGAVLTVLPLNKLDEIEAALGPLRLKEYISPRRAGAAAFAAGLIALACLLASAWLHAPIALAFSPLSGAEDATPQRARYNIETDKLVLLSRCYNAQREPIVLGGETLLMRVKARDGLPGASMIRPMRLFIASVSQEADPVLLNADRFKAGDPSAAESEFTAAIPIERTDDEIRLFVLATRDPSFEISELQAGLRRALQGLKGPAVLTTTAGFLADKVGAEIDYQFKVSTDASVCPV